MMEERRFNPWIKGGSIHGLKGGSIHGPPFLYKEVQSMEERRYNDGSL